MAKQNRPAAAPVTVTAPAPRPSSLIFFSRFGFFFLALCLFSAGFLAGVLVHQALSDHSGSQAQSFQSAGSRQRSRSRTRPLTGPRQPV